jgi:hypothetical protein
MPRNGSGTFTRIHSWVSDLANNINITASRTDADTNDIAAQITNSVAADGQTTMSGNLKMGTNRVTGMANGTARTDAVTVAQLQDNTATYAVTTGSSDAYVITPAIAITSYVAGQRFICKANFTNTAAVTIAVSGLAAMAIKKNVTDDLSAADIRNGQIFEIFYDGVNFQLIGGSQSGSVTPPTPVSGTFVLVGSNGKVSISTDDITYILQSSGSYPLFSGANLNTVFANVGRFHIFSNISGDVISNAKYIVGSSGASVTAWGSSGASGNYFISKAGVCSNGNLVFLRGNLIGTQIGYSTTNGTTAAAVTPNVSGNFSGGINGNDILMCHNSASLGFSASNDGGASYSTSGVHTGLTGTPSTNEVAFLNGQWLIGTNDGQIGTKTTATGTALTLRHTSSGGNQVNKFLYTGTKWVAFCNSGKVENASVIGTWTSRTTGLAGNIVSAAYNSGTIVIGTSTGEMAYSTDNGDTWTNCTGNPFGGAAIFAVEYIVGKFRVSGASGKYATSSDGITFSAVTSSFGSDTIYAIAAV